MGGCAAREGRLKVRVFSVGKDRAGLFRAGVEEYARRLTHYTRFELVELPEASGKKLSAERARTEEADALLARKGAHDWLIALDERGKLLDSRELAALIEKAQNQSRDLMFVVGGDEGLDPRLRETAQLTLSLSKMTFPHRLAKLMLVEQIYRAFTLLKGEPYHK